MNKFKVFVINQGWVSLDYLGRNNLKPSILCVDKFNNMSFESVNRWELINNPVTYKFISKDYTTSPFVQYHNSGETMWVYSPSINIEAETDQVKSSINQVEVYLPSHLNEVNNGCTFAPQFIDIDRRVLNKDISTSLFYYPKEQLELFLNTWAERYNKFNSSLEGYFCFNYTQAQAIQMALLKMGIFSTINTGSGFIVKFTNKKNNTIIDHQRLHQISLSSDVIHYRAMGERDKILHPIMNYNSDVFVN